MKFQEVINQDKLVLVDFYGEWCGPCKTMAPILQDLKQRVGDQVSIIKIDIDKNFQAAMAYEIRSVPTLILFRKGKILWRKTGVISQQELEKLIQES
jgi:thioredoxin 1